MYVEQREDGIPRQWKPFRGYYQGPSVTGDRIKISPANVEFVVIHHGPEVMTMMHHYEGYLMFVPTQEYLNEWRCG